MDSRVVLLLCFLWPNLLLAATRPAAPVIIEPERDDLALSAADVHMATAPFQDEDGNEHFCSDWEIVHDAVPVWSAPCVTASLRIHIHLGDGTFAPGHVALNDATAYLLRVRHRDDSGDADTEWSEWSERPFRTVPPSPMPPFVARDFLAQPAPRWTETNGVPVDPPPGAVLRLEAPDGEALVQMSPEFFDAPPFATHATVRVVLAAGEGVWRVPESELALIDDEGNERKIFLPLVTLPPATKLHLWVSANGSTHLANAEDRAPDFLQIARGAPIPWTAQKGYRVEHVAGGLQLPVNIAFVPNPRDDADAPFFYVTELYGDIKVVTRNGNVRDYAIGLLGFDPGGKFPGDGETGLVGIVVEPISGDVLVTSIYRNPENHNTYPRVLRLSSDDGGLTASRIAIVLDRPNEHQAPSHQISNISIGPDGAVYFHMGDAHFAPFAQSLDTMRGKILRMNLDGSPHAGNPFYDVADGINANDYIFAWGFRNPFGGAWRAADGMLYEIENGPTFDRFARVERGRNYGWDGTNDSMRDGAIGQFQEGAAPVNVAFVQNETFGGSGFPSDKQDRAFITESGPTWSTGTPASGKRISEIALHADGTHASGPSTFVRYDGTGKGTVSGIAAGPDGLYFTTLYKDFGYTSAVDRGAHVFRVRWTGYAEFAFNVATEDSLRIEFLDRSVANDASSWHWDFGDGSTSTERNPQHRYARAGAYLVTLSVVSGDDTLVARKMIHLASGGSGLRAEYYSTPDLSGDPTQKIEPILDWEQNPPSVPTEVFSVRWRGRLKPRVSELHRLIVEGSGDVRLWINGQLVIDGARSSDKAGEALLTGGAFHDLAIEYVHRGGTASMRLSWESDTQPRAVIPASVLFAPAHARRRATRP